MKRYIIPLFLAVVIFLILTSTAMGATNYLYRIAVLPFDDGSIKDRWWKEDFRLGEGITDELITVLAGTKRFRLIERGEIDRILGEQNLGIKGLVDPKTAAKIGKILGVQYLVLGRVTDFSRKTDNSILGNPNPNNPMGMILNTVTARVSIDARLVDAATAEILTSVTGTGERKNIILGAATKQGLMVFGSKDFEKSDLGRALHQAVNSIGYQLANQAYDGKMIPEIVITGKVAYVSRDSVIINIGARDAVEEGMTFVVNHPVDLVKDPETGAVVDEVTEPVAEIIVKTVKERTATCTVTRVMNGNYGIVVADRVRTKDPVPMAALPPLTLPADDDTAPKAPNGKIYIDWTAFTQCQINNGDYSGNMAFYGGEYNFNRFRIAGERVMSSKVETNPSGRVDITEFKIGYDLNNDSDYKIALYGAALLIDWEGYGVKNSSYMFGADVGYDLAEKTSFDASFGYGFTPATSVNGIDEGSWTNITTIKMMFSYAIATNIDLYGGYRSYMISRQQDQNLSGITAGLALKF